MQFGFTLKPDHTIERTLALTRQAEAAGFDYGWLFDSHVLWRDPYPLLTLMAGATTTLRLGTCVTNPATREPIGHGIVAGRRSTSSRGGRMDLGIGRGDSARRVLGKPPTTMATLEEAIGVIRDLVEGRADRVRGHRAGAALDRGAGTLPVWVAGYGPMALEMTGRIADGVILQLGRSGPHPLVRRPGPGRRGRRRPATRLGQGHGRRAGPRRRPGRLPRADPLVPGPRQQPRRRPGQQVPARRAARGADRLRPRPERLRLPPPRRGRLVERGVRRRRGHRPVLRPGLGRRPHRQAPRARRTRASTSSTST